MLDELTWPQFVEWLGFLALSPAIEDRVDWLAAMLGSTFTAPFVKKGASRPKMKNFLPDWGRQYRKPERTTPKAINAALKKFVAMTQSAYGGKNGS